MNITTKNFKYKKFFVSKCGLKVKISSGKIYLFINETLDLRKKILCSLPTSNNYKTILNLFTNRG